MATAFGRRNTAWLHANSGATVQITTGTGKQALLGRVVYGWRGFFSGC